MRKRSTVSLATFAVLAMVLGGAALAWACGPQSSVTVSPGSGETGNAETGDPGSTVTVSGAGYETGPVEIRWNGAELLGTATGPGFSVAVTVPAGQTPGQTYYIVASQPGGRTASTPFTVTGVAQSSGTDGSTGGGESPATSNTSAGAKGVDSSSKAPTGGTGQSKVDTPTTGTSTGSSGSVVTDPSGRQVFGPSEARSSGSSGNAKKEPVKAGNQSSKTADEVASSEGLYSGLESPAVLPSPFDSAVGSESSNLLTIGVGLLGAGLVAMFAGVLIAELRRRRVAEAGRRLR